MRSNRVQSLEEDVEWIADCMGYMEEKGFKTIELNTEAEQGCVAQVNAIAAQTIPRLQFGVSRHQYSWWASGLHSIRGSLRLRDYSRGAGGEWLRGVWLHFVAVKRARTHL